MPVTEEEVRGAMRKMAPGRAPGPDGVPNLALGRIIYEIPAVFMNIFTICLTGGIFPTRWKVQRLVLIPKIGKPSGIPSSFRPICLLDGVGKVLERIIVRRLEESLEASGGLSPNQYGFRRGRSALGAVQKVVEIARGALFVGYKRAKQGRRALLASVTSSIILYGAQVWYGAVIGSKGTPDCRAYRLSLLRVVAAYRTVSTDALQVIAGRMPLDLRARYLRERAVEHQRAESRSGGEPTTGRRQPDDENILDAVMRTWQERWSSSCHERWTWEWIPSIEAWMGIAAGGMNFHLTQLQSGHGCFGSFLHKIGRRSTPDCSACPGIIESPVHVLAACPRFEEERRAMSGAIGSEVGPGICGQAMVTSAYKWRAVDTFAAQVMRKLEVMERENERLGRVGALETR